MTWSEFPNRGFAENCARLSAQTPSLDAELEFPSIALKIAVNRPTAAAPIVCCVQENIARTTTATTAIASLAWGVEAKAKKNKPTAMSATKLPREAPRKKGMTAAPTVK